MRRLVGCCILFSIAAVSGLSADTRLDRVFDPARAPKDVRLEKPIDLNKPFAFKANFKDKAEWEQRRHDLREQVLVANGLWPMPDKTPLNPVIHGKIDRDEYTIEKVFFASLPGHYVSGNLYRPKGKTGKLPAVLCPHGHWANGRLYECSDAEAKKQIASGAEKTMEGAKFPLQARCAMLARLGCVVFFYDMVGNADSKTIAHRAGFADAEAELRLQSAMGLQTWNSIRAFDFISGLPEVDPRRIGVTGASGGGTQTFILGAVDDRIAAAFPAVMVSAEMQGGCICENCSLLRVGTNNIEIAALFAPKPQMMSGADDWTRRIETNGLPDLKAIYALYGAEDKVNAKYASFPHNYNQVSREMMYNWFNKHLGLGQTETIVEKPFVPAPPKELSVYTDTHPRPSDAKPAGELRKYMTEQSDLQLKELAKKSDEYNQTVLAALRAMVNDKLPNRKSVTPTNFSEAKGDGFVVHKSTLVRKDSGEELPTIGVVPANWNQTIVVWAHPQGKASLFDAAGKPVPQAKELLDRKCAIMACDMFGTGEYLVDGKTIPAIPPQPHHNDIPFTGYFYGYNRSLVAQRAHDLLTVIAFAQAAKTVHLVAFDDAGVPALVARVLAGSAVKRSAVDVGGFHFGHIKDATDPRMLPGALKYGGVTNLCRMCAYGDLDAVVVNFPKKGVTSLPTGKGEAHKLTESDVKPEGMVSWLLR